MYGEVVGYQGLPAGKRLIAARVAGAVSRLSVSDAPLQEKLAELRAITVDPQILGAQLGAHLGAQFPAHADAVAIELLRAAGADEAEAAAKAEWQRDRISRQADGWISL